MSDRQKWIAERAEKARRVEMMQNHLAGKSEDATGTARGLKDETAKDIERLRAEIANLDRLIAHEPD